jgi:hypothetical protein
MRDWADNPIAMFPVLRACVRVAPVGARNAGIILCCRRSEEAVSYQLQIKLNLQYMGTTSWI